MSGRQSGSRNPSLEQEIGAQRKKIGERLRKRHPEIEAGILTRAYAISGSADIDPIYQEGLRATIAIALDYAADVVELGEAYAPPQPAALLAQARLAVRNSISLDIVLRRYIASYALLNEVLMEEIERSGPWPGDRSGRLLQGLAAVFDRLIVAVTDEYLQETVRQSRSSETRRVDRVKRLLEGQPIETSVFDYDFNTVHTGAIAIGPNAAKTLLELARKLDCRNLHVRPDDTSAWAWFATQNGIDFPVVQTTVSRQCAATTFAFGEPAPGLEGWRQTHREAVAALAIARRRGDAIVRYADVALLASVFSDRLFSTALHRLYIAPLEEGRGSGKTNLETLCTYFRTGRSVSSSAASLGISRQATGARLRAIEERLSCNLRTAPPELEIAARLWEEGGFPAFRS